MLGEKATPIYQGFTQQELDAEYNNQAKISLPEFQRFLARCEHLSADARDNYRCHLDVPYGDGAEDTVDIFIPHDIDRNAPVEVFFHGGYWRMLNKSDFSYVAAGFVPQGYVTVIVNYPLVPTVPFDTLVEKCRRATAWVYRNIQQYNGDRQRMYLSGHSAGAHLVAMMLATQWQGYGIQEAAKVFRGAAAVSGIYDLEAIRLSYLNEILGLSHETVERNSPVALRPQVSTPLLLVVGSREGKEYLRQSTDIANRWSAHGVPTELAILGEEDHFSIRAQFGVPESALMKLIIKHRRKG